jgi:hypothetical protein
VDSWQELEEGLQEANEDVEREKEEEEEDEEEKERALRERAGESHFQVCDSLGRAEVLPRGRRRRPMPNSRPNLKLISRSVKRKSTPSDGRGWIGEKLGVSTPRLRRRGGSANEGEKLWCACKYGADGVRLDLAGAGLGSKEEEASSSSSSSSSSSPLLRCDASCCRKDSRMVSFARRMGINFCFHRPTIFPHGVYFRVRHNKMNVGQRGSLRATLLHWSVVDFLFFRSLSPPPPARHPPPNHQIPNNPYPRPVDIFTDAMVLTFKRFARRFISTHAQHLNHWKA